MMKKLTVILFLMLVSVFCFASDFEFDVGAKYEYTFNIGAKYSSCAAYGVEADVTWYVLHADIAAMYIYAPYSPLKVRASLGFDFDFWGMRTTFTLGNVYSLVKNGSSYSVFCGGLSDTPFWDAPLTLSAGVYKLFENMKIGVSAHFATPLIISKNNLPDLFSVMKDRNLLLYYLKSSSLAVTLQWRFL